MKEGFWYSQREPHFPKPVSGKCPVSPSIVDTLRKATQKSGKIKYRGFSTCRICGKHNGIATCKLDGWEWPEGFLHYVEDHNVLPTDEFVAFLRNFKG